MAFLHSLKRPDSVQRNMNSLTRFMCDLCVGRQFDKDGRIRMWWTEKAVEAFNNRAQCFVEQYNDYKMFGITVRIVCKTVNFPEFGYHSIMKVSSFVIGLGDLITGKPDYRKPSLITLCHFFHVRGSFFIIG